MNKLTILLFALVALSWVKAQDDVDSEWENFKAKHGKSYQGAEEASRKKLFAAAHAQIKAHNNKKLSYEMAHNMFSAMTPEEKQQYVGARAPVAADREITFTPVVQDRQLPASFDYRSDACLNPVRNQDQCGSCWAFAAIASLEFSKCKKNNGTAVMLSEQQLIDCSTSNYGCNGGWYTKAWSYLAAGSASMCSYPYTALAGTCKFSTAMSATKVSTYVNIAQKNPVAMQSALVTYGPLAVYMNVVSSFYSYSSGVYSDSTCTGTSGAINHAVNIVGYGTLNGIDFWIIRNSWGPYWGANGYVLMKSGVNMCNVELYPGAVIAA